MSNRKKIILSLILSIFAFFVSFLILKSDLQASAVGDILVRTGKGLFYSMSALSFVFLLLLISPQSFPAWKKFAKWAIPIMALIFIFYPEPGGGDMFSPYPEQVFRWVSVLYVVVSILIILKSSKR